VAQRQAQEAVLPAGLLAQVARLSLPGQIELTKTGAWSVTVSGQPYPASADRIDGYLKTLGEMRRERLVGRAVTLKDYGLDAPRVVLLKDKNGKTLAELRIGSPDAAGSKVYVQLDSGPEVWETDRALTRVLDVDFNTWTDLALAPGKKASDLTRLTFTGALETTDKTKYTAFDLVKGGTPDKPIWENQLDKSKPESVANWVTQVANFRFGAYAAPGEAPVLDGSSGKLVLSWGDNTRTEVQLGQRDLQNRFAATDGQRRFWINEWALSQLLFRP
jgi:hypothetical protein